jgi:hypothetical protein
LVIVIRDKSYVLLYILVMYKCSNYEYYNIYIITCHISLIS